MVPVTKVGHDSLAKAPLKRNECREGSSFEPALRPMNKQERSGSSSGRFEPYLKLSFPLAKCMLSLSQIKEKSVFASNSMCRGGTDEISVDETPSSND